MFAITSQKVSPSQSQQLAL